MAKTILETEPHSPNRALVASFLFTDLVGFSKGTAAEQYAAKATLSAILHSNLDALRDADYRLKDTGDGALIAFTSNPEHALYMALAIAQDFGRAAADAGFPSNSLRTGVHLGAVKEAIDLEARPNFVGDGINAAKRIMDFAAPGQITASRAFFDAVAGLDAAYGALFTHVGAPGDKHGRAHELYTISPSPAVLERLKSDLGVAGDSAIAKTSSGVARTADYQAKASHGVRNWVPITAIVLVITAIFVGMKLKDSNAPSASGAAPESFATPASPTAPVTSPRSAETAGVSSTLPSSQPGSETITPASAPAAGRSNVPAPAAADSTQPANAATATPRRTEVRTRPKSDVTAASAGNAAPDRNSPRCSRIMEKATLGEALTTEEKKELASSCR